MRRLLKLILLLGALGLTAFIAAVVVLQTDWFRNKVRERIISEIETITGGRVEIGQFRYDWHTFTADVAPFTLHGTEPPGGPALFRAGKIHIGLKVISLMERSVDIAALTVENPEIQVTVNADGSTNLPTPRAAEQNDVVAEILKLKIQHFVVTNGVVAYNSRRIPLDLRADNVAANLHYLSSPPRYTGEFNSKQVHITSGEIRQASFDLASKFTLEKDRIRIHSATLAQNKSNIQFAGSIVELASPRANFDLKSRIFVSDLARISKLPIESRGDFAFTGKVAVQLAPLRYNLEGRLNGRDLAFESKSVKLRNVTISSNISATSAGMRFSNLDLAALNGHFRGFATVDNTSNIHVAGQVEGFSVRELAALQGQPPGELNGTATGPVQVDARLAKSGFEDLKAHATLQIVPGENGVPIQGTVEATYDQRSGIIELGDWNLMLGSTVITATGTLGQTLTVHVTSSNLRDLLLAVPLFGETPPETMPVKLSPGGAARFEGTVRGQLVNPAIAGRLQLTNFEAEGRKFSRLDTTLEATKSQLDVRSLMVDGDVGHITATGQLGLVNGRPADNSPLSATVTLSGAIAPLVRPFFPDVPVSGAVTSKAVLTGTYGSPRAAGQVQLENVTAYDESLSRVRADINYADHTVEVLHGTATAAGGETSFNGVYTYSGPEWKSGRLRFDIVGRGLALAQIKAVTSRRTGVEGQLAAQGSGHAHFIKGDFQLDELDAQMSLQNAVVDRRPVGNLKATAKTRGQVLDVRADADLRGTQVHGQGEWRLSGDYPGQGEITIPRISLATLKDLIPRDTGPDLPFGGFLSATVNISGPLKKLEAIKADATVAELQINASPNTQPRAGAQARDLVLRNARPLIFEVTSTGVDIRSAQFAGTDTTVQAAGRVGFSEKDPWLVRLNGSINLAILQLFNPDLLATGVATLNATVRGSLSQPDLNGRLELKNASLFLSDLPNGVEKANGVIVFDRNRASVEKLSGESGGGTVSFQAGSFVGFSNGLLIYRIQADAGHVRYRDSEGFSITAFGRLSIEGTSERSTLSGTVSVVRAAFLPQTDVGSLLASTAKPISVPTTPNAYVRGIQFDVRIDCAQNLEVITSLTRDIQVEANLRFRGNVERPILTGNIAVTQGEIDFFGNKYSINRGLVTFANPAKIEPVVDMDLETHVRGITVDVRFNGPLEKLSFSYRSDPPLESNQIIALLAVGREPVGVGALASSQATTNTSYLSTGGNALLAQAVTAPVSGRLQRFFGVSHIKIDPQLTDITSVPQARVTLEQQISKDITLTYVTNLSRTSEQIVRVEWDMSRHFSVVFVRDENGLFGVDFQYRKTFR